MGFSPKKQNSTKTYNGQQRVFPTPEGGSQPARVSLIIDLGIQERDDFEDPKTGELKPQKPAHQLAVFVDLVDQELDYGEIGIQPYRLMLNKSFAGVLDGVNFSGVPYRDGDGKIVETTKAYTFHPASLLTKLAKATGHPEMLDGNSPDNMNVMKLLGEALFVEVEVKQTESGKKNDKGEPIIYTNVAPRNYTTVPKVKGQQLDVAPLKHEALLITFENATPEMLKWVRKDVLRKIQAAQNYEGSNMQKAVMALGNATKNDEQKASSEVKQPEKASPKPSKAVQKKVEEVSVESMDGDSPF